MQRWDASLAVLAGLSIVLVERLLRRAAGLPARPTPLETPDQIPFAVPEIRLISAFVVALSAIAFLDMRVVGNAVALAVATYGRLDAAFNAAGIDGEHGKRVAEATMENWNRVIAVDLTGTFSCMRYELPEIVKAGGGAIVNCASVAGLRAAPKVSAYTAAKHGVVGLTKAAAREYAAVGVRVNAICPGTVDTPMFRQSMGAFVDQLVATNPSRRLAEASEIATVAVWLCEDAPGFLTGEAITVDGGASA
jgi:NAD(P)-dependent dehydrogenase (short-subunit alcohol dehydrogenase family)